MKKGYIFAQDLKTNNMKTEVEKIVDLKFDPIITIGVIEKDSDLTEVFKEDINLPFPILYRLAKEDGLSDETKELLESIFDKVILAKPNLIESYKRLGGQTAVAEPISEIIKEVLEEIPGHVKIVEEPVKDIIKDKVTSKKENDIPRRYGKVKILADIKEQGGKATNPQLTALAVNDLKNMWVNLSNRLIKDMLLEDKILTDEDMREIRSAIKIVEAKLKHILKKK
jgi:hypothetical protein